MEGQYFKTWDSVGRRYLVKKEIDDEWELAPTPTWCITRGRMFNNNANMYDPPPSLKCTKKGSLVRIWDSKDGRWVFVVNVVAKDTWEEGCGSDEEEPIGTDVGVDINVVRKKYF